MHVSFLHCLVYKVCCRLSDRELVSCGRTGDLGHEVCSSSTCITNACLSLKLNGFYSHVVHRSSAPMVLLDVLISTTGYKFAPFLTS